jgi:hypothetical protein
MFETHSDPVPVFQPHASSSLFQGYITSEDYTSCLLAIRQSGANTR